MAKFALEITIVDEFGNKVDKITVEECFWERLDDARNWMKALYVIFTNMVVGKTTQALSNPTANKKKKTFRWFGKEKV